MVVEAFCKACRRNAERFRYTWVSLPQKRLSSSTLTTCILMCNLFEVCRPMLEYGDISQYVCVISELLAEGLLRSRLIAWEGSDGLWWFKSCEKNNCILPVLL